MDEKTKSAIEVCERIVNNAESMLEGREAINHVLTELKDFIDAYNATKQEKP